MRSHPEVFPGASPSRAISPEMFHSSPPFHPSSPPPNASGKSVPGADPSRAPSSGSGTENNAGISGRDMSRSTAAPPAVGVSGTDAIPETSTPWMDPSMETSFIPSTSFITSTSFIPSTSCISRVTPAVESRGSTSSVPPKAPPVNPKPGLSAEASVMNATDDAKDVSSISRPAVSPSRWV